MAGKSVVPRGRSDRHSGKGNAQRAAEAEAILADHVKGMRLSDLCAKYGVSHATVSRRLRAAIDARLAPTVDAYREQQNALLDELMADHQRNLEAGTMLVAKGSRLDLETGTVADSDMIERGIAIRTRALEGMGRVAERRARLNGLDAPVKADVQVTVETTQERELRDLLDAAAREQAAREAELRGADA